MREVLEVRNLSLMYGKKRLLNNISLSITQGECVVLVGKSGSGKSLLALAFQGFVAENMWLENGEVYLNDQEVDVREMLGKVTSCIMQNPRTCFNPLMSMREHAVETLVSTNQKIDDLLILESFLQVGLSEDVLSLYAFEMSGGMLQRAMIALSLLSHSRFLIADEPTTDLDILTQNNIVQILKAIKKNMGILLITHDLRVAYQIADKIVVLSEGEIVEKQSREKFFSLPHSEESKKMLLSFDVMKRGFL